MGYYDSSIASSLTTIAAHLATMAVIEREKLNAMERMVDMMERREAKDEPPYPG